MGTMHKKRKASSRTRPGKELRSYGHWAKKKAMDHMVRQKHREDKDTQSFIQPAIRQSATQ
jgi:hypothetical protein